MYSVLRGALRFSMNPSGKVCSPMPMEHDGAKQKQDTDLHGKGADSNGDKVHYVAPSSPVVKFG